MRRLPILAILIALIAAVPAAAAVKAGSYKGRTDQNRAVTFKVSGGKVKSFRAGVMTFCMAGGDSSFETDAVANVPAIKVAKNGRFRWTAPEDTDGIIEMTVEGRVSGRTAKGKVTLRRPHSSYDSSQGRTMFGQCSAERKWTARVR
jgi:hypothetical protein